MQIFLQQNQCLFTHNLLSSAQTIRYRFDNFCRFVIKFNSKFFVF